MLKFLNYFYLAYVLIKPALNMIFFSFDGAGRIPILLGIMILFFNINNTEFKKVLKLPSVVIWSLWGIYTIINWSFNRVENEVVPWIFIGNDIFGVWIAFVIVIYESKRNYHAILKLVLSCLCCYVLLGLIFQSVTEDVTTGRRGAIIGNLLPLTSVSMVAVATFLSVKKWLTNKIFILILLLSISTILFVATRKALGALLIILFFWYIAKHPLNSLKNWFYVFCLGIVFCIGLSLIIDYTVLGERLQNIDETADVYNTSNIAILDILGDRAYFYIKGIELFKDHPISGIGINNFMYIDELEMPLHTEYMTQLVENGILGTVLYIMFYFNIFKQIIGARKKQIICTEYWPYIGWMIAILFISLTAWVYSFKHYYIVLGLIIGGILNNKMLYDKSRTYN